MTYEDHVRGWLSEHYRSYILIGYDYDGNNIVLKQIANQEELDALSASFQREGLEFENNIFHFDGDEENEEI